MNEPALVTIGIPTVNRLGYLKEAVASALAQTHPRVEVVIGHDPGESGLDRAVAEWGRAQALANPRVRYGANARRMKLGGNFNATADRATGKYLILIGDDDRLLPSCVAELVSAVESAGARLAFSNHWFIDSAGARLSDETESLTRFYGRDRLEAGLQRDPFVCAWRNSVPLSVTLFRTEDVVRLRFREDINLIDIEFFARLAAAGGTFTFVPDRLGEYRTHGASATVAGLQYEESIEHLGAIPVPPESEAIKRRFLEGAVYSAAKDRLLRGDTNEARTLLAHEYYPRPPFLAGRAWARTAAQRALLRLPGSLGASLMRGFQRLRRFGR